MIKWGVRKHENLERLRLAAAKTRFALPARGLTDDFRQGARDLVGVIGLLLFSVASADVHVHVVLLAIVDKRDGFVGALRAIEDNARHGLTPVVAYADVVERLTVAVVDLE